MLSNSTTGRPAIRSANGFANETAGRQEEPRHRRQPPGGCARSVRRSETPGTPKTHVVCAHNPEVAGSNPAPATRSEAGSEQGTGLLRVVVHGFVHGRCSLHASPTRLSPSAWSSVLLTSNPPMIKAPPPRMPRAPATGLCAGGARPARARRRRRKPQANPGSFSHDPCWTRPNSSAGRSWRFSLAEDGSPGGRVLTIGRWRDLPPGAQAISPHPGPPVRPTAPPEKIEIGHEIWLSRR